MSHESIYTRNKFIRTRKKQGRVIHSKKEERGKRNQFDCCSIIVNLLSDFNIIEIFIYSELEMF